MTTDALPPSFRLTPEVADALASKRAVVALESTIVVHGLPAPQNLEVAAECEAVIRAAGAVPATIAVVRGEVRIGLSPEELAELADPSSNAAKLSARDIGIVLSRGGSGATTVAGTISLARRAGISVMATGGLGGVHRGASTSFDESADLTTLSRTSILVVSSGVKSILDVGATLERLDTLGVPVVGFRTTRFPGFYLRDAGFALDWSGDSPAEVAAAFDQHRTVSATGMVLANPVPLGRELDQVAHDAALAEALAEAGRLGVSGKAVTPVILAAFARATTGVSVQVNRDLVVSNASVAAAVAVVLPV